jgi:hypothetical protein
VGINRHAFDPIDMLLPQGALDGRPRLAAVQHDRLIVENAPRQGGRDTGTDQGSRDGTARSANRRRSRALDRSA